METYVINGHEITDLTTTREGNSLILRKGKTSLLSAKIMLVALLNVENRINYKPDTRRVHYYEKLQQDTGVDYCNGLISEINVADLKRLLNRSKSGSFYYALKELFSTDPRDEKSLRNSWCVMMPNSDSGILGYAEVITACHYDTIGGKLFLKFSSEPQVFKQLWKIQEDYTELPFKYMLSMKSVHSYRLAEILLQRVGEADQIVLFNGGNKPNEYSFKFSLGELQLMLGAVDITSDKDGKSMISTSNPDYNSIVDNVLIRKPENMGQFSNFRRYALDVAIEEINSNPSSPFDVNYVVERNGKRKIISVVFGIKMRNTIVEESHFHKEQPSDMEFIVELTRELSDHDLKYSELVTISEVANYDKELIIAAKLMYDKLCINDNFAEWFLMLNKK